MEPSRLKRTVLVPLAVAFAGLAVAFVVILALARERLYERDMVNARTTAGHVFDTQVQFATHTMEGAIAAILGDKALKSRLAARDRGGLLAAARPLYFQLNVDHGITHFYFIGPDGRTILRIHDPDRYGDVLSRATLRQARERETTVSGIEIGPLGTLTLRVVAPWMEGPHRLGFVELGIDVSQLVKGIEQALKAETAVFVYKDLVDQRLWERGMKIFDRTPAWDLLDTMLLTSHENALPPPGLIEVMGGHEVGVRTGTRIEDGERLLLVTILPIRDATGWEVGDVAILTDITPTRAAFIADLVSITVITLTVGALLFVGFYWLLDQIQERLLTAERDLVETAEAAEAANQSKSTFLAMISHELRTPLNAIIGFSEMIKGEMLGPLGNDAYKGYVNDIHRSGTDLLKLIADILDISKMEIGEIRLDPQPVDVSQLVQAATHMTRERANSARVALLSQVEADLPPLKGDELRLKQILLNLITNALKFTPAGGQIVVVARREDKHVALEVTDTGIGMNPEDIPKVLDPFVQLADQMTRNHEGAGLGLPLTKHLVELHEGTLVLESTPGQGTTATIRLPISPAAPPSVEAGPSGDTSTLALN